MYDELVKRLRESKNEQCYIGCFGNCGDCKIDAELEQAADAIEERDRYALTIQHEMMSEAESHIALVERLNKQIEELRKPRWIPVTERCPEKSGDYLVFDDCRNLYVNEWHCLLKKWQYDDSRITHWMPLQEPPKEDSK